jgi:hypothetical protein
MRSIPSLLAATLLTLSSGLALAADSLGAAGSIVQLEINHTTADTYLQYHGRVVLLADSRSTEYRWGGTSCSNKSLTESQVTMLQRALESGTPIVPRFQAGQGTNKCLVGFVIAP